MATQADMPIREVVAATRVDKLIPVHEPIQEADMSIPTAVAAITVDPLILAHGSIPGGVVATTTVEKDIMADMATTVAEVTMGDADIMAADMATSAGEVFI
jgi:hypothetical protein